MRLKGMLDWVMVTFRTGLYPAARELRYSRWRSLPGMDVSSCSTCRHTSKQREQDVSAHHWCTGVCVWGVGDGGAGGLCERVVRHGVVCV